MQFVTASSCRFNSSKCWWKGKPHPWWRLRHKLSLADGEDEEKFWSWSFCTTLIQNACSPNINQRRTRPYVYCLQCTMRSESCKERRKTPQSSVFITETRLDSTSLTKFSGFTSAILPPDDGPWRCGHMLDIAENNAYKVFKNSKNLPSLSRREFLIRPKTLSARKVMRCQWCPVNQLRSLPWQSDESVVFLGALTWFSL